MKLDSSTSKPAKRQGQQHSAVRAPQSKQTDIYISEIHAEIDFKDQSTTTTQKKSLLHNQYTKLRSTYYSIDDRVTNCLYMRSQ